MSLQARRDKNKKTGNFFTAIFPKNRKGLSIIIGYVLLIAISVVMSVVVFVFLKTYVPKDTPQCSEGTSIFIKDLNYDCANNRLEITLKNNGKFSIHGFYIRVSNKADEELATIDLSSAIIEGGETYGNSIVFMLIEENFLSPSGENNAITTSFDTSAYGALYKIEIIPTRLEEIENKKRLVSCSNAKVEQALACS